MKLAALLLVLLAACGETKTHHVVTGPPGPPYYGGVTVVLEGQPLPPTFVEVAIVQAVGRGDHADLEHVIQGLRWEAGRLGCDVVIHVRIDQGGATASANGIAGRTWGSPPPSAPIAAPAPAFAPTAAPATAGPVSAMPAAGDPLPPP